MKKILYTIIVTATVLMTACSKDDDTKSAKNFTLTFETAQLDSLGRSWGTDTGSKDALTGNYKIYNYAEGATDSMVTYVMNTPSYFWCNWALSNNNIDSMRKDYSQQFSTPLGAYRGKNYAVCYYAEYMGKAYAPTIHFSSAVNIKSLMLTNNTTTLAYVAKYPGTTSAWKTTDELDLVIEGMNGATKIGTVTVALAKETEHIQSWTKIDLTALGSVTSVVFSMTSTDVGSWGINTPTYACIDDVVYTK